MFAIFDMDVLLYVLYLILWMFPNDIRYAPSLSSVRSYLFHLV